MKTIKLPYTSTEKFQSKLKELRQQYSCVVRYSYNRFIDGKSQKEIRSMCKSLNHIELLDSWLIQCAIMEGFYEFKHCFDKKTKQVQHKSIFGGKYNFIQRAKNKITKEEFKEKRLLPLTIQGEAPKQGNRKFILDIIENNQIVFKLDRKKHYDLTLPNLRNNIKTQLFKLQESIESNGLENKAVFQIKLTETDIFISFEETALESNYNEAIYMGIDLNPSNIGISICKYNLESSQHEIIDTKEFSLQQIFDKIESESNSSDSNRMKYFQNKLNFESIEIAKKILILAKQFNCKTVFIEDLKFKSKLSKDQKYNHKGNRKNRNLWKRNKFIQNLSKRLAIFGIQIYEVNPAYSSIIGNFKYDFTDPINASFEIGRRGFEWKINKNKKSFYPNLESKQQWKQMVDSVSTWKELNLKAKNLKLKYRVSLEEATELHQFSVFRLNGSKKSMIKIYNFYQTI